MVYLHVTMEVQRRKMPEWVPIFEKYALPLYERHGQKLVGAWKTSIGVYDEVVNLYRYESLGDLEGIRREIRKDPDWLEYMNAPELLGYEVSKVIEPLSYSPMQ